MCCGRVSRLGRLGLQRVNDVGPGSGQCNDLYVKRSSNEILCFSPMGQVSPSSPTKRPPTSFSQTTGRRLPLRIKNAEHHNNKPKSNRAMCLGITLRRLAPAQPKPLLVNMLFGTVGREIANFRFVMKKLIPHYSP